MKERRKRGGGDQVHSGVSDDLRPIYETLLYESVFSLKFVDQEDTEKQYLFHLDEDLRLADLLNASPKDVLFRTTADC